MEAGRARLAQALEDVEAMLDSMVRSLGESIHLVGLNATPYLHALAELTIGWLLLRQSEVAFRRPRPAHNDRDRPCLYEGKVAAADWYSRTVLPGLS